MDVLRRDSPFRVTDWRWQRGALLAQRGLPPSRVRDDEMIAKAARYSIARAACRDEFEADALNDRWEALSVAHAIRFANQGSSMYHTRQELESRLLSGQAYEAISYRMSLSRQIVEWYEGLFFNVRDRIDRESWVLHYVLGPTLHTGFSDRDIEILWKLFAYKGGPLVLDAILAKFINSSHASTQEGVSGFVNQHGEGQWAMKNCIAAYTANTRDTFSKLQVAELHLKYAALKQDAGRGGSDEVVRDHLQAMLRAFPFGVGPDGKAAVSVVATGAIEDYDRGGRELRTHEMLAIQAGMTMDRPAMPEPSFPGKEAASV